MREQLICKRCNYHWKQRALRMPVKCPNCTSRLWRDEADKSSPDNTTPSPASEPVIIKEPLPTPAGFGKDVNAFLGKLKQQQAKAQPKFTEPEEQRKFVKDPEVWQ